MCDIYLRSASECLCVSFGFTGVWSWLHRAQQGLKMLSLAQCKKYKKIGRVVFWKMRRGGLMHTYICVIWLRRHEKRNQERENMKKRETLLQLMMCRPMHWLETVSLWCGYTAVDKANHHLSAPKTAHLFPRMPFFVDLITVLTDF